MIKPTRRAIALFCAGVPASLAIVLIDQSLWQWGAVVPVLAVFVIGVDAVLAPRARDIAIDVQLPDVLYIGESDDLQVALGHAASAPASHCRVLVELSGPCQQPPPRGTDLLPGQTSYLSMEVTPERRGEVLLQALWLQWTGPLSLVARQRRLRVERRAAVVPNVRAVRTLAINFASQHAVFGVKPQRQQGDGSEFEALRDYVAGLDHRSIDWKHSARHARLVCKEFRSERNQQIVFAFDSGHLMSEPLAGVPKLDHTINAALLMAYVSLRGGDRVGVFGFDSKVRLFAEPLGGLHSFARLQREVARLDYRSDETNFTLGLMSLFSRLSRRTLVIVMTEFVDTITADLMVSNLQRLASRHLVLFVTLSDPALSRTADAYPESLRDLSRAVLAEDFLRDRRIVHRRLQHLGVRCLEAPKERIGAALINQYLAIKQQELL